MLDLLREGLTNEQIAERLGISKDGAKYHVAEILSKLGVSSRQEAAQWSAAGERPRPWWAALPVLGRLWKHTRSATGSPALGHAALASSGVILTATLAVLGLIAFLLLRNGDAPTRSVGDALPLNAAIVATLSDLTSPTVSWSPQGDAFALQREDGLYLAERPTFELTLVTHGGSREALAGSFPRVVWSPDGTRLAFAAAPINTSASMFIADTIYVTKRDGSDLRDVLGVQAHVADGEDSRLNPNAWLDNKTLAFDAGRGDGYWTPMTVDVESGQVQEVVREAAGQTPSAWARISWSPNGERVALDSSPSPPLESIVRIVKRAGGESWDLAGYLDAGLPSPVEAWLSDSSGVLYHPAEGQAVLNLAIPESHRVVELANAADPAASTPGYTASWVSPDGRFVATDGLAFGGCPTRGETSAAQCVSFTDTAKRRLVSSLAFLPGEVTVGSGPYGLLGWVGSDAVAFIGMYEKTPYRVLWLVRNPEDPRALVWQEETPGEGWMGMDASPNGRYAVVTMPTSENLFPATNFWEARVYEMP